MVYLDKCSMFCWKECVFCICRCLLGPSVLWCSWNLLFLCLCFLYGWPIYYWKSPTIIILELIYPFMSINICLIYLGAPIVDIYLSTYLHTACDLKYFSIICMSIPTLFCIMFSFHLLFSVYECHRGEASFL
jgi:hypothetical protein